MISKMHLERTLRTSYAVHTSVTLSFFFFFFCQCNMCSYSRLHHLVEGLIPNPIEPRLGLQAIHQLLGAH